VTHALWIIQGLLALLFLFAARVKLVLAARAAEGPVELPGLLLRFIRRGRGTRRGRADPPGAPAHSAGPDTAGRRRAGDHHDRRDGDHAGGR